MNVSIISGCDAVAEIGAFGEAGSIAHNVQRLDVIAGVEIDFAQPIIDERLEFVAAPRVAQALQAVDGLRSRDFLAFILQGA